MARRLKDWLNSYVKLTTFTEPPESFRTWVGISTIASCLERKVYTVWGMNDSVFPNMFIVLTGPSGVPKKTTAIKMGYSLLSELSIHLAADSITREAFIRAMVDSKEVSAIRQPNGEFHYLTHSSVTVHSEELTTFLGYRDLRWMTDLGSLYDCKDPWIYQTKHMGTDTIPGTCVNLLGATTPELLQEAIPKELIKGGFASRLILVHEEHKGRSVPFHDVTEAEKKLRKDLIADLETIHSLTGAFTMSDSFLSDYTAWYMEQELHPTFVDQRLSSYQARRAVHLRKLSMILSVARSNSLMLLPEDLMRGIKLLAGIERKLPALYRTMDAHPLYAVEQRMKDWIAKSSAQSPTLSIAALVRAFGSELGSRDLADVIMKLKHSGFCDVLDDGTGGGYISFPPKRLTSVPQGNIGGQNGDK